MKEQLRTEAEKYFNNKYPLAESPYKENAIIMLADFHAQQLEKPVERLKSIIEACPKGSFFRRELSKVLTSFKESKQLEKDNWVSVSERFPSENQTVWCYSEKLDNVFLGEYVYVMNEGWFWAESNGVIYASGGKIVTECEIDDFDVSHWYPTPTLPKKLTTQTL